MSNDHKHQHAHDHDYDHRHDHPAHPSAAGEAAGRAVEPGADVPQRPVFPETNEIPAPGLPISAAEYERLKDAAAQPERPVEPDDDEDDTLFVQEDPEEGC